MKKPISETEKQRRIKIGQHSQKLWKTKSYRNLLVQKQRSLGYRTYPDRQAESVVV